MQTTAPAQPATTFEFQPKHQRFVTKAKLLHPDNSASDIRYHDASAAREGTISQIQKVPAGAICLTSTAHLAQLQEPQAAGSLPTFLNLGNAAWLHQQAAAGNPQESMRQLQAAVDMHKFNMKATQVRKRVLIKLEDQQPEDLHMAVYTQGPDDPIPDTIVLAQGQGSSVLTSRGGEYSREPTVFSPPVGGIAYDYPDSTVSPADTLAGFQDREAQYQGHPQKRNAPSSVQAEQAQARANLSEHRRLQASLVGSPMETHQAGQPAKRFRGSQPSTVQEANDLLTAADSQYLYGGPHFTDAEPTHYGRGRGGSHSKGHHQNRQADKPNLPDLTSVMELTERNCALLCMTSVIIGVTSDSDAAAYLNALPDRLSPSNVQEHKDAYLQWWLSRPDILKNLEDIEPQISEVSAFQSGNLPVHDSAERRSQPSQHLQNHDLHHQASRMHELTEADQAVLNDMTDIGRQYMLMMHFYMHRQEGAGSFWYSPHGDVQSGGKQHVCEVLKHNDWPHIMTLLASIKQQRNGQGRRHCPYMEFKCTDAPKWPTDWLQIELANDGMDSPIASQHDQHCMPTTVTDTGNPVAVLTRVPQTGRLSTGTSGSKRNREPDRPAQPEFSESSEEADAARPSTIEHPGYHRRKSSYHPFNFGIGDRIFTCTGALGVVLGKARARLWAAHAEDTTNPLPVSLTRDNFYGYSWILHDAYAETLTLSCNHSLLHAAFCVPVCTLNIHGVEAEVTVPFTRQEYMEPSYPFSPVEEDIPVPGASYGCARMQQCYAFTYLSGMSARCPGCTKLGTYVQRDMDRPARTYTRQTLAKAAWESSIEAMQAVRNRFFGADPIMGTTLQPDIAYHTCEDADRTYTTEAYIGPRMVTKINDCTCEYCKTIQSRQRFPLIPAGDGCTQIEPERLI